MRWFRKVSPRAVCGVEQAGERLTAGTPAQALPLVVREVVQPRGDTCLNPWDGAENGKEGARGRLEKGLVRRVPFCFCFL